MMGRKLNDLTGSVFDKLTVLYRSGNEGKYVCWVCVCECGKIKKTRSGYLTTGRVRDCGCEPKKSTLIDLSGKKFGRWLVVMRSKCPASDSARSAMWDVVCDCGKKKSVSSLSLMRGGTKSCGCYQKDLLSHSTGEKNPKWIGGNKSYGYDYAKIRTFGVDELRRDPANHNAVQARCSTCHKWFTPTKQEVSRRLKAISGNGHGESKYYCSDGCKISCSVFGQVKHQKGLIQQSLRHPILDPASKQMVLIRDSNTCQKCGSQKRIEVHHIEGIVQNPMLANDINNCISVCHDCHKLIHKLPGCTRIDYRRHPCGSGIHI